MSASAVQQCCGVTAGELSAISSALASGKFQFLILNYVFLTTLEEKYMYSKILFVLIHRCHHSVTDLIHLQQGSLFVLTNVN